MSKKEFTATEVMMLLERLEKQMVVMAEAQMGTHDSLNSLKQTVVTHNEKIDALYDMVAENCEDITQIKFDISDIQNNIKAVQHDNSDTQGNIKTIQNDIKIIQHDIVDMKKELHMKADKDIVGADRKRVDMLGVRVKKLEHTLAIR